MIVKIRGRQRIKALRSVKDGHVLLLFRASPPVTMDRSSTAGLLAHGYQSSICLPAPDRRSGMAPFGTTRMDGNPLTVAGAATVLVPFGSSSPCSLLIPSESSSGNRRFQLCQARRLRQAAKSPTWKYPSRPSLRPSSIWISW